MICCLDNVKEWTTSVEAQTSELLREKVVLGSMTVAQQHINRYIKLVNNKFTTVTKYTVSSIIDESICILSRHACMTSECCRQVTATS